MGERRQSAERSVLFVTPNEEPYGYFERPMPLAVAQEDLRA